MILALLINKNSAATVWVFARLHHAYGKGYHGSGSLFPFKRRFNFKAHISPQEGRWYLWRLCVDYADDGPVGAVLGPLMIRLMIDLA